MPRLDELGAAAIAVVEGGAIARAREKTPLVVGLGGLGLALGVLSGSSAASTRELAGRAALGAAVGCGVAALLDLLAR